MTVESQLVANKLDVARRYRSYAPELTWQFQGDDQWVFGHVVRGLVRRPLMGDIYFDEERDDPRGGWIWIAYTEPIQRGLAYNLEFAAWKVEHAWGLVEEDKEEPEPIPPCPVCGNGTVTEAPEEARQSWDCSCGHKW